LGALFEVGHVDRSDIRIATNASSFNATDVSGSSRMKGWIKTAGKESPADLRSLPDGRIKLTTSVEGKELQACSIQIVDDSLLIRGYSDSGKAAESVEFLPASLVVQYPVTLLAQALRNEFPSINALRLIELALSIGRAGPSDELLLEITRFIKQHTSAAMKLKLNGAMFNGDHQG
jgi:hypothetical protein